MADADARGLRLERLVPVAPAAVFAAHVEPELLARWWGPADFVIPSVELDVRPGGAYRIAMQPPNGDVFYLSGQFHDVVAPERLVYTFAWEDPAPDDIPNIVTVTYRRAGASTTMTVEQRPFATDERLALHVNGWTDSLDKLSALCASDLRER